MYIMILASVSVVKKKPHLESCHFSQANSLKCNHLLWLWHLFQWNCQNNLKKIEAETCGWYLLPLYPWTDSDK